MRNRSMPGLVFALVAGAACPSPAKEPPPTAAPAVAPREEKEAFGRLTLDDVTQLQKDAAAGKVTLAVFDNNTRARFDKGHVPGARWVKFDEVKASDLPPQKDATLVFYCANEH